MSIQQTYFCDHCEKQISMPPEGYGPLTLTARTMEYGSPIVEGHLCSHDCAMKWTDSTTHRIARNT